MINVFIVDDHPFIREGLKTFLNNKNEITVIGEAGDGSTALTEIKKLQPDVAVIDLHLPGIGGIELTRELKQTGLNIQIIILSSFCEDEEIIEAIEAGALSYVMKDSPPQKLAEAILASKNGEPVLHPLITKKLMQKVSQSSQLIEPLTAKEKEVLIQLVKGNANKEIASLLSISDATVKTHVSNILRKLDVNDRTQAVIKAIELKLV